jgi:hypothetical protein
MINSAKNPEPTTGVTRVALVRGFRVQAFGLNPE